MSLIFNLSYIDINSSKEPVPLPLSFFRSVLDLNGEVDRSDCTLLSLTPSLLEYMSVERTIHFEDSPVLCRNSSHCNVLSTLLGEQDIALENLEMDIRATSTFLLDVVHLSLDESFTSDETSVVDSQ